MRKNTKRGLLVLILLLTIGYAAVTTTLVINGTITLGENQKNFEEKLAFTKASLTYSDASKAPIMDVTGEGAEGDALRILDKGKKISFTTDTLTNIGEKVTLTYDITNNSQYDAEFTGITCKVKDKNGTEITGEPEYIKLTSQDFKVNESTNIVLATNKTLEGHTLVIEQIKSFAGVNKDSNDAETTTYTIECTINTSGLSAGTTAAAGE